MLFKLWRSYRCRGCIVFTLSNFVEDFFQGFKVLTKRKRNMVVWYGGVTTIWFSDLTGHISITVIIYLILSNFVEGVFQGFKVGIFEFHGSYHCQVCIWASSWRTFSKVNCSHFFPIYLTNFYEIILKILVCGYDKYLWHTWLGIQSFAQ